jgi:tetratricopeptide (TPR) repeat protein
MLLGLLALLLAAAWFSGGLAVWPRGLARQALQRRDYDAAESWASLANRLSYHDAANALLSARLAREQGNAERLMKGLTTAKKWGADAKAIRREQLLAMAQTGQLDGVESELVALLGEGGDTAEVSQAYANGLTMHARFEDALSVLEAWRLDFPRDPRPAYRMGRMLEHQEAYQAALESYQEAVSKDGKFLPARYSLGRVLLHQRRAEEAAEQFRQCLASSYPEAAQVELALALKALGQTDEARTLLRQVVQADSQRLQKSYLALDEQPEGFKAASEYGKLETDAGNFAEAERWLNKALEANPQDLLARYAYAVALRGLGKQQEAEEQFARVRTAREAMQKAGPLNARIKRNARDVQARFELGKLVLENESRRSGLYWIRSVFAYDPTYRPAHEFLAEYYAEHASENPEYASLAEQHRRMAEASSSQEATP